MTGPVEYPRVDGELARRLESAEGRANAAFVATRARLEPEIGAASIEVDGAWALFDGFGSPVTQSFGLGTAGPITPTQLRTIEAFFESRGSGVFHEVSPLAQPSPGHLALLHERGYRPIELTSVLYRPLRPGSAPPVADRPIAVRPIAPGEAERWAGVAAEGWTTDAPPEVVDFVRAMGRVSAFAEGSVPFLAEIDGTPVAAGALSIHGGVAILAGASTIPAARGRGAQLALLAARLEYAAERGCDLAMMGALPGSGSQRNAERRGFRIAYTRIKWAKTGGVTPAPASP